MTNEINALKVLLTEIKGEIELGEERLKNKLGEAEYLKSLATLKAEIYSALKKIDDRITGMYIKVAGFSGIIVGILELIFKATS